MTTSFQRSALYPLPTAKGRFRREMGMPGR